MLAKMGWKGDGAGLGKNQQGTSTNLRAVRRSESLGIGADSDAFGDKGWQDTNRSFHGVLDKLNREYSGGIGEGNSSGGSDGGDGDDKASRKRRRKEEKKRKRREEKRNKRRNSSGGGGSSSDGSSGGGNNGVRLPQNKVQAGHARKMREAKDIRNKSAEDMAAVFGVKADFYKQSSREWVEGVGGGGGESGGIDLSAAAVEKKKKSKKRPKELKEESNNSKSTKKDKKKRKRTREGSDPDDRKKSSKKDR